MSDPFRYSADEWTAVWEQLRDAREIDTRSALEEEAQKFLSEGTPSATREAFDEWLAAWRRMCKYAWALAALKVEGNQFSDSRRATIEWKFAAQLKLCGYGPDLEFEDGSTLATAEGRENFAWFCETMIKNGRGANAIPEGNDDPARRRYIFALCDLWGRRLGRTIGASWDAIGGNAGGPMVRFLVTAANPALQRGGRAPLLRLQPRTSLAIFVSIKPTKVAADRILGHRSIM